MVAADWRQEAACAAHENPTLWFASDPDAQAEAIAVCRSCPVVSPCLEDAALRGEGDGIRGGRVRGGRGERRRVGRVSPPIVLPAGVEHGTAYGYRKGCQCEECLDAQALATRQTSARRRRERAAARGCAPTTATTTRRAS